MTDSVLKHSDPKRLMKKHFLSLISSDNFEIKIHRIKGIALDSFRIDSYKSISLSTHYVQNLTLEVLKK